MTSVSGSEMETLRYDLRVVVQDGSFGQGAEPWRAAWLNVGTRVRATMMNVYDRIEVGLWNQLD